MVYCLVMYMAGWACGGVGLADFVQVFLERDVTCPQLY